MRTKLKFYSALKQKDKCCLIIWGNELWIKSEVTRFRSKSHIIKVKKTLDVHLRHSENTTTKLWNTDIKEGRSLIIFKEKLKTYRVTSAFN